MDRLGVPEEVQEALNELNAIRLRLGTPEAVQLWSAEQLKQIEEDAATLLSKMKSLPTSA